MIILDFIVLFFILYWAYSFKNWFKVFNNYDKLILNYILFYHIFFSIIFYIYIIKYGGDATNYWFVTYFEHFKFKDVLDLMNSGSATGYMMLFNYIPAKILNLSFFTGNILYGVLGYQAFVFIYAIIKENIPKIYYLTKNRIFGIPIFPYLLFLPNLHFWSAGIGKDTLLFFTITLFFYAIKKIRYRFLLLIVAISLSFFVRPHIILFLLIAYSFGVFIDRSTKIYKKLLIITLLIIALLSMYRFILDFINLKDIDMDSIEYYTSSLQENSSNERIGSSVNVKSYSYPLKIFTFLFRPLFSENMGLLGIIASVENVFLLFFTFKIFRSKFLKNFRNSNYNIKSLLLFFIIGTLSFSAILGNLGIILRQKNPFIITFIIFGYWTISNNFMLKKTK